MRAAEVVGWVVGLVDGAVAGSSTLKSGGGGTSSGVENILSVLSSSARQSRVPKAQAPPDFITGESSAAQPTLPCLTEMCHTGRRGSGSGKVGSMTREGESEICANVVVGCDVGVVVVLVVVFGSILIASRNTNRPRASMPTSWENCLS